MSNHMYAVMSRHNMYVVICNSILPDITCLLQYTIVHVHRCNIHAAILNHAATIHDDDVFYLFLQKQKIGAELHIYLEEGTYHKRLFRGPNTNDMKK